LALEPHTPDSRPNSAHPLGREGENAVKVRPDDVACTGVEENPIWVTSKANIMVREKNLKRRFIFHSPF
jgi:hypothetical protein